MRISDWSSDVCSSDLGDADPALGGIAPAQGRGDMPLGRRAIGEGSGLRLTARADPPPAGFDDDHAKEVEAGGDAVAPANVSGRAERHQLDGMKQGKVRADHGAEPQKSAMITEEHTTEI